MLSLRPFHQLLLGAVVLAVSFEATNAFIGKTVGSAGRTDTIAPLQSSKTSSSSTSFQDNDNSRRDVLAGSLGAAALLATGGWKEQQQQPLVSLLSDSAVDGTTTNKQFLPSLDAALELIDAQCDRRFLHAVVSSDYRLLYRGVPARSQESKRPFTMVTTNTNTNLDNSKNKNINNKKIKAPKAADFKLALLGVDQQQQSIGMNDDWTSNSNSPFHVAGTNPKSILANSNAAPNQSSSVVSVWPLGDNVHFAWPELQHQQDSSIWKVAETNGKLIIDGVDCGVMSLEDALERPDGQVMLRANSYLMVPASMEQALVNKLKQSFII